MTCSSLLGRFSILAEQKKGLAVYYTRNAAAGKTTYIIRSDTLLKLGGAYRLFAKKEKAQLSKSQHWDVRYLVLTQSKLSWSKNRLSNDFYKELELSLITSVKYLSGKYLEKPFVFRVVTEEKDYLFAVDTKERQMDWVQQIAKQCGIYVEMEER